MEVCILVFGAIVPPPPGRCVICFQRFIYIWYHIGIGTAAKRLLLQRTLNPMEKISDGIVCVPVSTELYMKIIYMSPVGTVVGKLTDCGSIAGRTNVLLFHADHGSHPTSWPTDLGFFHRG